MKTSTLKRAGWMSIVVAMGLAWTTVVNAASSVTLSFTSPPAGTTVSNGAVVSVSALATTSGAPVISSMALSFRTWAPLCTNLWNTTAMATTGVANTYQANIPRLPAGNVDYFATCIYSDGATVVTNLSATNTFTISATLISTRGQDFDGAYSIDATGTNWWTASGWTGASVFVKNNTAFIPALNTSPNCMTLLDAAGAFVMSPVLTGGVNNVYFQTAIAGAGYSSRLVTQLSTNNGLTWQDLQTNTINSTAAISPAVVVNTVVPSVIRFWRPFVDVGGNNARILLDSICISYPGANLALVVPSTAMTPPLPQSLDKVTLYCNTQDGNTNVPTINRQLNVIYNRIATNGVADGWKTQAMVAVTGVATQYSATLPPLDAGTNQYYFRCDYDGYYYTNTDKNGAAFLPAGYPSSTNQYAINPQNVVNQQLSPATLAFGMVMTNQSLTNTLVVSNAGNVPLHVTNIVCTSGFNALLTSFTLPASTSSNVPVVFSPTALGPYSGTLTVYSDMTIGQTNIALTGTGMNPEAVSTPTLSGPASGMVGTYQTFNAFATDSWGYAVNYQFAWGNGTTSSPSLAASASNAWATANVYSVSVQAASAVNPAVTSVWSAPVSITITNTRIIGLSSNSLNFGSIAVNAIGTASLTVTNSGNGPLTVSNITFTTNGFTAAPTFFSIPAGGSSNVTVTFTPPSSGFYTGMLVVVSDASSGLGTIPVSVNVTAPESVSTPSLIAAAGWTGNVGQVQFFTATNAVDSYTNQVQYQIDWGDSSLTTGPLQPSASAMTTSHVWAVASNYNLRVRAWSGIVSSGWSAVTSLTITNTRILGLSAVTLPFGNVVTNTTSNLVLTVSNSGNGPLTVSNIVTTTAYYKTAPTNFVLPANGFVLVTNTFSPKSLTNYTDTLTVISDATSLSSTNTVALSGTGIVAEAVSQPMLSVAPTNAGTLGTLFTFSASATDTWTGATVNYLFSWGNGSNSGWTASTTFTTNWNAAGVYTVVAQARSAANTTVVSSLSAPVLVTITNVFAVNVSPASLAFGSVATNAITNLTLTVTNTGNGALTVTNVICSAAGFTAGPTSFIVPTNSVQNVTVTFTPTAITSYAGIVTVAIANPFSGNNTVSVSGTGVGAEVITAPQIVILPTSNGTTGDVMTVSNTVLAVDNWGVTNLSYRYDTGDGQTSAWITAIATNHVWANAGTYQVRAQATNSNSNVASPWSSNVVVTMYSAPVITFAAVTNGLPLPVTVSFGGAAGSVSNAVLYYLAPGSTAPTYGPLGLATNAAGNWTNALPPLDAGLLNYYLLYTRAGIALRFPASGSLTLALTNDLGAARQQDFEGAFSTDGGSNYWTSSGWTGSSVYVFAMSRLNLPINSSSNVMLFLDLQNALLITPNLPAGIGNIYFETALRSAGYTTSFNVDVSTNNGTTWFTEQSFTLSNTNSLYITIPVNLRAPSMVRWIRTSADSSPNNNNQILFDKLAISPPPTDVTLSEFQFNPGYPNAKDPTHVRCIVSDVDIVNEPSVNRRVTLWYQAPGSGWVSTNMAAITLAGVSNGANNTVCYDGVVPASLPGTLYYYFKCDFDGYFYSNSLYAAASESKTPEYLASTEGRTVVLPYRSFFISNFRKDNSDLNVLTTNPLVTASEQVMTLVDDYTWQGVILMKKTGGSITNLDWIFSGNNYYASDAPTYSLAPEVWGDTNQDFVYPPLSGTAELGVTNQIQAQLEYDGFLVVRLNTHSGSYLAKRAVFQDFNNWQASQDYFEASVGLYATLTFTNDFANWPTNYYQSGQTPTEAFTNEPLGVWYGDTKHITSYNWAIQEAKTVLDRGYLPPNSNDPTPRKTLYLNNDPLAPGVICNTARSLTTVGGVHNFTICSRLSVSDPYPRFALFTRDLATVSSTSWGASYHVVSTNRAQSVSPGTNASVSLILNYRHDSLNPYDTGSFYEFRLCQVTDSTAPINDSALQLQLYRWINSKPTLLYSSGVAADQSLSSATPFTMDVTWSNTASSVVFSGSVTHGSTNAVIAIDTTHYADGSTVRLSTGGVIGYLCADAVPEIQSVVCYVTGNATPFYSTINNGFAGEASNWFLGESRPTSTNTWWQIDTSTAASGYLVRPVTPVTLTISQAAAPVPPPGNQLPADDGPNVQYLTNVTTMTVSSLGYVTNTIPFNLWKSVYVQLQYTSGDLPVAVDIVGIDSWRAVTCDAAGNNNWGNIATVDSVPYYYWTSTAQQYKWSLTEPGWAMFEGWVTPINGNRAVMFDCTRANPDLIQGMLSPILSNGIGSVIFDATVLSGTSVYRVDRTVEGDMSNWVPVQTFTNTVVDATINRYVPIRTNFMGRIRIVQIPGIYTTNGVLVSGSSSNAVLMLDNLKAKDFPPQDETSWKAYNALIAQPYTNSITYGRDFPDSPTERRTCYLNNGQTNGVLAGEILADDNPYLQTPKVTTGIGEIDFWYRAWDTNAVSVTIKVAANELVAAANWTVLTNFTVTSTNYAPFAMPVFDTVDKVMRIYTQTNSNGRLCLDNVLMTEPIRPGYEITGVVLTPGQPLYNNAVALQAQVGHFLMNPSNICLYLSYHVGTDTWGYANWRGLDLTTRTTCVTIPLQVAADGRTFSTPAGAPIPQYPIDTVVQYVVWGTFDGITGQAIFEGTNAFANPTWYYPVDLNKQNENLGWAPYYFVYSCPPGSVWFNEINYIADFVDLNQEYIEIAGPTGVDVSNWRIDVLSPAYQNPEAVWNSLTMPAATIFQEGGTLPDQIIDGWSYLTWGDDTADMAAFFSFVYPYSSTYIYLMPWGGSGLRLVRSNGAYEQRIVDGANTDVVNPLINTLNDQGVGYQYIGAKDTLDAARAAPLQLQGRGSAYTNFYWIEPSSGTATPGSMNIDQHLLAQLVFYSIYSVIGSNGQQTDETGAPLATPLAMISIASGASTSIVYTANQWFKIASCTTNGAADTAALGATQYVWTVDNASQNYSNNVSFVRPNWAVTQYVMTPGGTATPMSAVVANGASTQLVYTAAQWYRIAGLASNGVAIAAATNQAAYTQMLFQVQADVSNAVSYLRPSWTIAQIVGPNGAASPAGSIAVLNGASTSIVYTAQEWFRITGLTTNSQAIVGAVGLKTNTVVFQQVTGNISNTATFGYASAAALGFPTNIPTSWVAGFGHSEATPFDNDGLSLATEYLLNTDPYTSNAVAFGFSSLAITGANAYVTVQLLVDATPHPTVNGKVKLYGKDNLRSNTWQYIEGTAINGTNAFNNLTGRHLFVLPITNGVQGFTHAVIE